MSTELAKFEYTPEQMRLITDVVAKGATKDELQLFLYRCKNLGLDPLKPGQIYFVKYGNNPGTIVVGIDGFRARANRTEKLAGIKRGIIKDDGGNLVSAWAEVYRTDWKEPAREEVPLAEYNTGKAMWAKMPQTMLKKVAEAAALRMAFPDELGGVYESAEMEQAEDSRPTISRALNQPPPTDGVTDTTTYYIPFGQWKGRTIEQVYRDHGATGKGSLGDYIVWLEDSAQKKNEPLKPDRLDFIKRASDYIASQENKPLEQVYEEAGWTPPPDNWRPPLENVLDNANNPMSANPHKEPGWGG